MTLMNPTWTYDEFQHVGVDFDDREEVADYDRRQGSDPKKERELINRLGIQIGATVVDLGCGTGSFAVAAARHGARVHAVDVSQAMLDYVARRAAAERVDGIEFHRAGFLTLPLPAASVDFIVTRYAHHHLPDFWKQEALRRMYAILRPGGMLYLEDVIFSFEPAQARRKVDGWLERMPTQTGYTRDEFEMHVRQEFSTYAWVIEGMLSRAGYVIGEANLTSAEYANYLAVRPPPA